MRSLALLALALPTALTTPAQTHPASLDSLRDTTRPLLIFAPTPTDPQLLLQLHSLQQDTPALTDRNILLIPLPYNAPSPTLTPGAATAARRRFHIAPASFTVILLGKDGGEKLRSSHPITLDHLCSTVDAMPMRRQEMRSRPPQ